jgi:hypothetical protein
LGSVQLYAYLLRIAVYIFSTVYSYLTKKVGNLMNSADLAALSGLGLFSKAVDGLSRGYYINSGWFDPIALGFKRGYNFNAMTNPCLAGEGECKG